MTKEIYYSERTWNWFLTGKMKHCEKNVLQQITIKESEEKEIFISKD